MKLIALTVMGVFCLGLTQPRALAQEIPKARLQPIGAMAICRTVSCLKTNYSTISKPDTIARFVYFSKLLELRPKDRAAAKGFLDNLPQTEQDANSLSLLPVATFRGDWNVQKMLLPPAFYGNMARALRLYPEGLQSFVTFGPLATVPPTFAGVSSLTAVEKYSQFAARLCRSNPQRFLGAFRNLSPKGQAYFTKYLVQPEGCKEIGYLPWFIPRQERPHLVAMATCKTVGCLKQNYAKIRKLEIVARIVYYSNLLRLQPSSRKAAYGLLTNMPTNDNQYTRLGTLEGSLFEDETDTQIRAVGDAAWSMSRNLARSLKIYPCFLPAFIRYGLIAAPNPVEDDYGDWVAQVCRSNPTRFLRAFKTLSSKDQQYVAKYIIQPVGCKQIAVPEAP